MPTRRSSWLIAIGGLSAVALGVAVAVPPSVRPVQTIRQALADPLSVLDSRSPGARKVGELSKTKFTTDVAARAPRAAGEPRYRVLSRGRAAPGGAQPLSANDLLNDPGLLALLPAPLLPAGGFPPLETGGPGGGAPGFVFAGGGGGGVFVGGGGGGAGGGGGSGGGGGGGDSAVTPPVDSGGPGAVPPPAPPGGPGALVPPVAAVPEPGTWLTMLLGFGVVGASMRGRRRALAAA